MAVFDVGQHVVNNAAGVISGNTAVDASEAIARIVDALGDMELGDLFLLSMETLLISITTVSYTHLDVYKRQRERRFWEWKFENDNGSNQKILIARQYVEN